MNVRRALGWLTLLAIPACYGSRVPEARDSATYDAGPADAGFDAFRPSDRRLCETDLNCHLGENCVRFARETDRLCARACPITYRRCADGLTCAQVDEPVPVSPRGYCFPGAETPSATCQNRFDCAAGLICSKPGELLEGVCADLYCERREDCEEGFLCRYGGCHPVCDERDPAVCPSGSVCFEGWCSDLARAATCRSPEEVFLSCPLGEVCVRDARDARPLCTSPETQSRWSICPEGTVWTGLLDGCVVPRRR